jgi:uncharacterized surface protein with fasciclin (FAS1) repeats
MAIPTTAPIAAQSTIADMAAPDSSPLVAATLAELVQSTPALSTMYDALVAANMVETLNSAGPFVLFAPTNDAFAKFPSFDEYRYLTDPSWNLHLQEVLKFHLAEQHGLFASTNSIEDLSSSNELMIPMLNGENVMVTTSMQGQEGELEDPMMYQLTPAVTGSATVVSETVMLPSNGELFQISNVLLPSFFSSNLFDMAEASTSTLTSLLIASELDGLLRSTLGSTVRINSFDCMLLFFLAE